MVGSGHSFLDRRFVSDLSLEAPTAIDASMLALPLDSMVWSSYCASAAPRIPTGGLDGGAAGRAKIETPGIIGSRVHCWGHNSPSRFCFQVLVFVDVQGQNASRCRGRAGLDGHFKVGRKVMHGQSNRPKQKLANN